MTSPIPIMRRLGASLQVHHSTQPQDRGDHVSPGVRFAHAHAGEDRGAPAQAVHEQQGREPQVAQREAAAHLGLAVSKA